MADGTLAAGRDYHEVEVDGRKAFAVHTQAGVAACFGVNRRTVAEWLAAGCPGKPGEYVVAEIIHWRLERDAGRPLCRECKQPLPKGWTS